MAITPTIYSSQAGAMVTAQAITTGIEFSQAGVLTVYNFPSERLDVSQAGALVTTSFPSQNLRISQATALVVGRGRVGNTKVRAWGFSQDGHDFYVLRLGDIETLVYDATTGQWANWDGGDFPFWVAHRGMNWLGMSGTNFNNGAKSPVVAGDDSAGVLWTLDPEQGYDDRPDPLSSEPITVTRAVRGGVPFRGRERSRTNAVWLTISTGVPDLPLAGITLRISDDQGKTWRDCGEVVVEPGEYRQEFMWRSLGVMSAPGRLFEFEDNGAMIRIDGADIDMTEADQ